MVGAAEAVGDDVRSRVPRQLHPAAWWLWAIGMAAAATRTTNPLLLVMIVAAVGCVVTARRTEVPWARGFRTYIVIGLVAIGVRVLFRVLLDGQHGSTTLFTLPQVHLPHAAAGIRIGGPVSLQGILSALYDGIRLATLLLCLGAANVLANPKRLLKALPGALHEIGVAATVALTVAPQLVESGQRVRRARRLRGDHRRRHVVRRVLIPVLEDALDRSLVLAAAMDSRGYGRHVSSTRAGRAATTVVLLAGTCGILVGTYGILDGTAPAALGMPVLAGGCAVAVVGLRIGSRRVLRTVYRPDPWRRAETLVAFCGVGAAAIMFAASHVDPNDLYPSIQPLRWPNVGPLAAVAVLVGLLPCVAAPPPPGARSAPATVGIAVR